MTPVDDGRQGSSPVWERAVADSPHLPAASPAGQVAVRPPAQQPLSAAEAVFGTIAAVLAVVEHLAGPRAGVARQTHDLALGLAWQGYRATTRAAGVVSAVATPAVRLVVDPPLVPRPLRLRSWADRAAADWRADRPGALRTAAAARDQIVPAAVDAALAPVDLTGLVVDRVDLEALVNQVLDRLDLTDVVVRRVDLERVVDAALQPLDLTQLVVERVNLSQVVKAALDQVDLTAVVTEQVDLAALVNAALDQMDLTALVRERVDLVGISEDVIDAVDLPEIIRASTGSVASEAVRSVRMQSINADDGVQRMVDRVILWRKGRKTDAPGRPEDYAPSDGTAQPPDPRP